MPANACAALCSERRGNPRCIACGAPATRQDADGVWLCEGDFQHLLEHWSEFVPRDVSEAGSGLPAAFPSPDSPARPALPRTGAPAFSADPVSCLSISSAPPTPSNMEQSEWAFIGKGFA